MNISAKKISIPTAVDPEKIQVLVICEAPPANEDDYFYGSSDSLYVANTIGAFNAAGMNVKSIDDIIRLGVYLTTAVKEPRKGLTVPAEAIEKFSCFLEKELLMFPNTRVILLMGDVAIKAMNCISLRVNKKKVIPPGSTYKIRNEKFYYGNIRVFPSYLQTGRNFLIEKAKRKMVAEDIASAFKLLK